MINTEHNEIKQTNILKRVVEQQNLRIHHDKLRLFGYEKEIEELQNKVEDYEITLSTLYPEKEVLIERIKYLDDSIRELNFHLTETQKSRERMINSLSWRCTAWIRWLKRPTTVRIKK